MTQPNDRHEATLPFTYDGYRRLRGPFATVEAVPALKEISVRKS
jgi:hypothetical protein